MFDITTTISQMSENPVTDEIRGRYPELAHIFDRLEELEELHEEMVPKGDLTLAEGESERLAENLEDCAKRFAQIRDMVETLAKMDAADPIMDELAELSNKADDGQAWADRMAAL